SEVCESERHACLHSSFAANLAASPVKRMVGRPPNACPTCICCHVTPLPRPVPNAFIAASLAAKRAAKRSIRLALELQERTSIGDASQLSVELVDCRARRQGKTETIRATPALRLIEVRDPYASTR